MSSNNQNQRLNGFAPISYMGQNAAQPTNFTVATTSPTADDARGFNLGDWWLNTTNQTIWYLAASNGLTATWINTNGPGAGLFFLTGNTGGAIAPLSGNINVFGDGHTISVVGNPGTSTLTMSLLGGNPNTLTGNTGGAVGPTAGNINLVGSGVISVVGNPATSTLTIEQSGTVAQSFVTQAGTAVPVANVLNVLGSDNISTSGAGSTVTITAGPSIAQSYITSPATGTATPSSGVITLSASGTTSISAAGSSITISNTPSPSVPYAEGTFTPILTVNGVNTGSTYSSQRGYYVRIGNVVFIWGFLAVTSIARANDQNYGMGNFPFVVSATYGQVNIAGGAIQQVAGDRNPNLKATPWWGQFVLSSTYANFWWNSGGVDRQIGSFDVPISGAWNVSLNGFYFI